MEPEEFLKTASLLVNSQSESDLRTSVSRSYYAVILFYRNYIASKLNIDPSRIEAVHRFVPECFNGSKLPEAKVIGEKIKTCKSDRTTADYKLLNNFPKNKAEDNLRRAKSLIEVPISAKIQESLLEEARKRAIVNGWIQAS